MFSGWQDANFGILLCGNNDGSFKFIAAKASGFYVEGDTKALANIKINNGSYSTLVSVSNDSIAAYSTNSKNVIDIIDLKPFDQKAVINYQNGKTEIREFYYGSGYYSQNTRSMERTESMVSISIWDSFGNMRSVE